MSLKKIRPSLDILPCRLPTQAFDSQSGAKLLSFPERPTNLDNSRTKACAGKGCVDIIFFCLLSFLFSFSFSLGDDSI